MALYLEHPLEQLKREHFQKPLDNGQTDLYWLQSESGLLAAVTNYGARLVALYVPDGRGRWTDVVLGFDTLEGYQTDKDYHGALVGRYANRIRQGRFTLHGKEYILATNNGGNHLHGGLRGFDRAVWNVVEQERDALVLEYTSPAGEEGYPGALQVRLRYSLTGDHAFRVQIEARTDADTPVNLTNHAYFNLNGQGSGTVLDHLLSLHASAYTPVDETIIPTGEVAPVEGTPFDFRHPVTIGARIGEAHEQLQRGSGYDHNFVLDRTEEGGVLPAARAIGNETGIVLDVLTTEPGIQLYTGNFLKGNRTLKYGCTDIKNGAFCLETQHFPDAPNQPHFPSTILSPDRVYMTETVFAFSLHQG